MKRFIIILLSLLGMSLATQAQTVTVTASAPEPIFRKNEVGIDLLSTIILKTPMISYEHILNSDIGVGMRGRFSFDQDEPMGNIYWGLLPNFRWYFSGNTSSTTRYATGLFAEVNGLIGKGRMARFNYADEYGHSNVEPTRVEKGMIGGLGLGLGYKYVNSSNWILQSYFYVGRIFNPDMDDQIYGSYSISIGYRF